MVTLNADCECKKHKIGDVLISLVSAESLLNMRIWLHTDSSDIVNKYQQFLPIVNYMI